VQALWCVLLALAGEASLGGCCVCIVCSGSVEARREGMLAVASGAFYVYPLIRELKSKGKGYFPKNTPWSLF